MDLFELSAVLNIDTKPYKDSIEELQRYTNGVLSALKWSAEQAFDFIGDSIKTSLDFEEAMAGVYSVTEAVDEGTQRMLDDAVLAEAAASSFTTAEVATAAYYEALAGFNEDEIVDSLGAIVLAAEASGEAIRPVADIITDTVRAFGAEASETGHYVDVFAAAATNSNTTISQMGNMMKYVAPLANALGYSVEDVAITYMLMADNGTKATMAGTSLRNMFTRLATNAGATNKDLGALDIVTEKLGVSFYDSEGKARPWLEFLDDARTAWRGLSDEQKNGVIEAFGQLSAEVTSGDEAIKQFNQDADRCIELEKLMNSTKDPNELSRYNDEFTEYYKTYKNLFEMLGIDTDKIASGQLSLGDAFDQVRIKLSGLSDEEKMYFSKQIGSMRGQVGWLELMNTTDEKFKETTDTIRNCSGAAKEMRDIRLGSNLWGDVEQLNSRLDVTKTLVGEEINHKLRNVAGFAIESLDNINEALKEGGIIGGLKQLSEEIKRFGDEYNDDIAEFIENLVPVISTIATTLAPAFAECAVQLGSAFAGGVALGIGTVLQKSDNPVLKWLGDSLVAGVDDVTEMMNRTLAQGAGGITSIDLGNVPIELEPEYDISGLQKALDDARARGDLTLKIGDLEFSTDYTAEQIADAIIKGGNVGSEGMSQYIRYASAQASADVAENISTSLKNAGNEGSMDLAKSYLYSMSNASADASNNILVDLVHAGIEGGADSSQEVLASMDEASAQINTLLSTDINNAGVDGGADMAANVYAEVDAKSQDMADTISDKIGNSGTNAGDTLANGIQSALNGRSFFATIVGNIVSSFTTKKHASAMVSGYIFRRPTVFGYDGNQFHMAGDAGPEAVVGVNSLYNMITKAVNASAPNEIIVPREADRTVNIIFELDGVQRFIYRANKAEEQRVGIQMAGGVM